jgi:hypothetical protein
LQDITNQNVLPVKQRKVLFSLKKALTLSSFASVIRTWQLKRISRDVEKTLERVTRVTPQKINSAPDTGPVKLGEGEMKVEEVLAKLEKHEAECNLRYKRIDEKLDEHKTALKNLDVKLWGLAILVVLAPLVHKLWG